MISQAAPISGFLQHGVAIAELVDGGGVFLVKLTAHGGDFFDVGDGCGVEGGLHFLLGEKPRASSRLNGVHCVI
jgi:hypothetical protein